MLVVVLGAWTACATAGPPARPTEAPKVFVERQGYVYAVVELVDVCVEASGLGGTHWSFRVVGGHDVLHGGGHGVFADDALPGFTGQTVAELPAERRYFVAQVALGTRLARHGLGIWCPDRTDYSGDVTALGRASGLADARARLAEVGRTGVLADPIALGEPEGGPRTVIRVPR